MGLLVNYPCLAVFHLPVGAAVILFPVLVFVDLFFTSLYCSFSGVWGENKIIGICFICHFNLELPVFIMKTLYCLLQ